MARVIFRLLRSRSRHLERFPPHLVALRGWALRLTLVPLLFGLVLMHHLMGGPAMAHGAGVPSMSSMSSMSTSLGQAPANHAHSAVIAPAPEAAPVMAPGLDGAAHPAATMLLDVCLAVLTALAAGLLLRREPSRPALAGPPRVLSPPTVRAVIPERSRPLPRRLATLQVLRV